MWMGLGGYHQQQTRHKAPLTPMCYTTCCLHPTAPAGEKPITYDREWRMHMPNPNLLRVDVGSGPDAIPRALVELVSDCGAYGPEQRPSMREVRGDSGPPLGSSVH